MRKTILFVAIILATSAFHIDTYFDADPQQCIEQKCPNQWAACQKDSKCVPALQDCEKKCGTKTSCWTLCLPGKGSQAAIDVAKCAQANGCVGMIPSTAIVIATPQQCIEQKCHDQLGACAKDAKCFAALQDCEKECGNSTTCYSTCLAKKGNTNASALWKCIIDNDCLNAVEVTAVATFGDIQQCVEQKCPNQWAACQKDSKCVPALQDCEKKCGTKSSCWTLCLPTKGSQAAIDVAKCAQANGCVGIIPSIVSMSQEVSIFTGPEECVMQYCKKEEQACVSDRRCIMVLDECDTQCNTNFTCWNACLARRGNKNASDYFKCIVDHECYKSMKAATALAIADPQQCIEEKCPNQWAACQKDPKCIPALQDCEKKCGTKESCWALCLPGKGSQAAIDVAKCAQANGCNGMTLSTEVALIADPQQCIEEKCPNQWAACQKDPKCVPALQDCEKKCGTKTSCWTLCLPGKGSQAAIDVAKCAQSNGCVGMAPSTEVALIEDPQQCIEEKCPTQWAACQKDPKCIPALQDCEKKCGTKTSCWTLCLPGKGSQAAIDTAKCAQANGCVGMVPSIEETRIALATPQECIEQKCHDQLAACAKDPKCFTTLQDCDKECGNSTTCFTTCLSKKGNANAVSFWKCILDNNCIDAVQSTAVATLGDPQQCIEEKCPTQWAACQKDPKCIPALQDCEKKCGTKTSCWTLCLPGKGSQAAIDTAKCAQANGCVGMVPAFESCMMKSCAKQQEACLSN
uniref:Predicted protein n=3 Tax=Mesangiospermae TaxID=1437183 RepID=F2DIX9_HORVV|nr:predicted protein [Hordeum vulgare subsp. vulgare]